MSAVPGNYLTGLEIILDNPCKCIHLKMLPTYFGGLLDDTQNQDELIDLSENLEEIEKKLGNLPEDDLKKMAEALKSILDNLRDKEINVNKLEGEIKMLPKDGDNVEMMNEMCKIKNRIICLIKQVTLGQERVENAMKNFELQKSTLSEFEEGLVKFEECLKNARASIPEQSVDGININDIDSVVQSKKINLDELKQISVELLNFESKVDQTDLGQSLRPRIVSLQQSFSELELYFQDYITSLQALANNVEEMKKHERESASRSKLEELESRGTPVHVRTTGESFSPSTSPSLVTNTASIKSKVLKNVDDSVKSFDSETSARASEASVKSRAESGRKHRSRTNLEETDGHDSLKDDTIDSSASPIHNEEVFEMGSPNFEYYEEIKFKEPVDMRRMTESPEVIVKEHKMIEKRPKEVQTTDSLFEELPKTERGRTKDIAARGLNTNPETGKRVIAVEERIPRTKSPVGVSEIEGTTREPSSIHTARMSGQELRLEPEDGSDLRVVRILRRTIRRTVIVNGVKTETEEIVEEPRLKPVEDSNAKNIVTKAARKDGSKSAMSSAAERISMECPRQPEQGFILDVTAEKVPMREDKNKRQDGKNYSERDPRTGESPATKSTKSDIPDSYDSGSLAESTDIILSTDFSKSSDSTKPTDFQFPSDIVDTGKDDDENDVSVVVSERFVVHIPELKKSQPILNEKKTIKPKNEKETPTRSKTEIVNESKLKESAKEVLPPTSDDFEYQKIKPQKKRKKKRKDEWDTPDRGTPERDESEGGTPGRDTDFNETLETRQKILGIEKSQETSAKLPQKEFISQPGREGKSEEKLIEKEEQLVLPIKTVNEENIVARKVPVESKKSHRLTEIRQEDNESVTDDNKDKKPATELKIVKKSKTPLGEIIESEKLEKQIFPEETESVKSKVVTSLLVFEDNIQKPVHEIQGKDDSYTVETVQSSVIKNNETPKNRELSAPVVTGQVEKDGAIQKGNTIVRVVEAKGESKDLRDVNKPVEKVDLGSFDTVAEQAKYNVEVEVEDKPSFLHKSPLVSSAFDQNKVPGDFLQQTTTILATSASPEMVDTSMQTSTPRNISSPDKSKGMQTEFKGVDSQIQTSDGEKDKSDHSFRHLSTQTSEEAKSVHETADQSQQTSKPVSPIVSEQKVTPVPEKVDESVQRTIETEEVAAQTDPTRKRGSKENDKVERTTSESDFEKEVKHPKKDVKEPIEVHVKAKLTLPSLESVDEKPGRKDKKERKRKWKEETPSDTSDTSQISEEFKGVDKQKIQIEPTLPATTVEIRPERPTSSVKVTVTPQEAEVKISVSQQNEKAEAKKEPDTSGPEKPLPFTEMLLRSVGINVPSPAPTSRGFSVVVPEDFDPNSCQNDPEFVLERIRNLRTTENMPNIMHHSLIEEEGFSQDKKIQKMDEYIEVLREALRNKDSLQMRYVIIYIIENIYEWFEYEILLRRQRGMEGPEKENVKNFELLLVELKRIKDKLKGLTKIGKEAKNSLPKEEADRIEKCIHGLEMGIKEMQDLAESERDILMNNMNRKEEFLNQVNILAQLVEDSRQELERAVDSDSSPRKRLEELEKIEMNNRNRMEEASKLLKAAKSLIADFPNQEIPSEVFTIYEQTKFIESNLNMERDKLWQLLSLEEEYEQTLKEFSQIIDIAEHLVDSPINIADLKHLQEEMQKHRKFFVNLSHCRGILESLEGNLDKETRSIHSDLHGKLHEKATVILDKAALRAQQMAMAASRWTVLEQGLREEKQWLQVAQQRVPDLQQVNSSDYDKYISLYQSFASDIAIHHSKIVQLMDVANNLQDIITCVALERFYDAYLNVVLKLQNEVGANLEKLLAFQASWIIYQLMTDKLEAWMKNAEQELIKARDLTTHGNMRHFWELKAQFEVHNRLKMEAENNFQNAMRLLPVADEATQKQIYFQLGDRWKNLEKKINEIQEAATASVSAKDIPVNDKLKLLEDELYELKKTANEQGGIIKNDEELNLYIERLQVLNGRLETIQEELGRLGLLPAAESEKVGSLLNQARRLEQQFLEELDESNLLRERLVYLHKGLRRISRNQASMATTLDRCESAEGMGSDVVERAIENCQKVSDDLVEDWQELMNMRQVLHNLPMRLRITVSPTKVERDMSQLLESNTGLEKRCGNLISLLRQRFCLWRRFEKQLELVQQNVQETDYLVELLTLQGTIDYDRLRKATDRLEDLHNSVGRREDLITELKNAAEPLCTSCDPEVSKRIQLVVDDAVASWNGTYQNLYTLRNKYKDAVKLWKQYREARDVVKNWLDQEMGSLQRAELHPQDAMHQIRVCEETLASHKARLDELRGLVAQIAADIGLEARGLLECEVDALGKRLEDVRETLTALTSAAESRTKEINTCKDELVKAKTFLGSVQEGLNEVETKEDEDSMSLLRSYLVELGKTESQVQNVKGKSIEINDKPHEIRNETSVVEILELWQQVFRETFQQYHRLSAKLVRSQDGAAALKLWKEYLLQVQTFLDGPLPEDYDGLCEMQRVCGVYQNLLKSQHSVLLSKKENSSIQDFSRSLQEQFNSLANLHNETLARIMDRHGEINKRLNLWDTYRHDQSLLLSWLRDMTREQSRLQLRYINLRRVPKLLEQIDMILNKIPKGNSQISDLEKQQKEIVKFCDEALATSIKLESLSIVDRVNNLEASMKSWRDFLKRIQDLHKRYDSELGKVEQTCDEVTSELSLPPPVSFSEIQARLNKCRDLSTRISDLSKNIDEANGTFDKLKECLSHHDVKILSQKLWLMSQRRDDLQHQLMLQINLLEDRLEYYQLFNIRHVRFLSWANDLINKFEKTIDSEDDHKILDLESRVKKLESDILIEMNFKTREHNWLKVMGKSIIDATSESGDKTKSKSGSPSQVDYDIMKAEVSEKVKEVEEIWKKLQNLTSLRLEKKKKITTTVGDLRKRIDDIRGWLNSTEEKLDAPLTLEKSSKKFVDKLVKDHDSIQKNIDEQSGKVNEVLRQCETLLVDRGADIAGVDTQELESAAQSLEKRWKALRVASSERKKRILDAWEILQQLAKICKENERWLNEREKSVKVVDGKSKYPRLNDVQGLVNALEKEKVETDSKEPALKILEATYSKLVQESRLPPDNLKQIASPAKGVISKWREIVRKRMELHEYLLRIMKLREEFMKNHNNSLLVLTNMSAKLAQLEAYPNAGERVKKLKDLKKELDRESSCLRKADELGLELMTICTDGDDISNTQTMIDEYQTLWKDLEQRFDEIRNKSQVESKEIQVSTLTFETDSQVQVDTLPHMERLTSRDAYGLELDSALLECEQNLNGLEELLSASEPDSGVPSPSHQAVTKLIAACTSSVELVQHLNETLVKHCGMSPKEARTPQVQDIVARFQKLVALAREREKQLREASERGRLTCPICARRNWQQLDNDLWRLEQWIQYAEAVHRNRPGVPSDIEALEDVIQDHRELLIELDSHKSIVASLNIVGEHLADHADDVERARTLRERLHALNHRWDTVCLHAAQWQEKLHHSLTNNPGFHDTIDALFDWLETTEMIIRGSEPVDLSQDEIIIRAQYKKFRDLFNELERREPRMQSLQEAAVQLFESGNTSRERLNALRLRFVGLKRLVKVYLIRLGAVLGRNPSEASDASLVSLSQEMLGGPESMNEVASSSTSHINGEDDAEDSNRSRFRFLGRVARASLPFQAAMLILLGAAVFLRENNYSCFWLNKPWFSSYSSGDPPV